jgi:hypothetical protein
MPNIRKIFKRLGSIMVLPIKVGLGGFKAFIELFKFKKEIQVKKTRCLYLKGNRLLGRVLETTDDRIVSDPFKQQLFFKTNTYLDEDNNEIMVMSEGYPVSLDLDKLKKKHEVIDSKVVKVEDVDAATKKLTYTQAVYYPLDLKEKDSIDGKELGNLAEKVFRAKVFQFLEPTARADLIMAAVSGCFVGALLMATIMYWLK